MKEVPFIVFESEMARLERIIRKLFILLAVVLLLLFATNGYWLWYESQFEDVVTVTQDNTDGYNNYVGNEGALVATVLGVSENNGLFKQQNCRAD